MCYKFQVGRIVLSARLSMLVPELAFGLKTGLVTRVNT